MSSMKEGFSRFKSMTRFMSIIVRISIWACFILAACFAVGSVVVALIPGSFLGEMKDSFEIRQGSSTYLTFRPSLPADGVPLKAALVTIFTALVPLCAWGGFFFLPIHRILASILAGAPFAPRNSGHLRSLALCIGLYPVAGWVSTSFAIGVAGVFPELARQMRSSFGYDPAMLVFAALLLILSGVFKYGEELQRDADGTV